MTECNNNFPHGSGWLRADFHLHTKADKEFQYTGDDDRFISDYVGALKSTGIRLGVITNHNKFDFNEFKALTKKAKKEDIFLLPGVELSVGDGSNGIHTLVVFNDKWIEKGQDHINPFLTSVFEGKTPAEYENENGRTSLGLLDSIKKLEEYNRDFFLVFAHVEDKSGLWEELGGGRLTEMGKAELFCRRALAFQKVRTHDKLDCKCRVEVKKWLCEAYPAEVEGSDPKSIEEIGKGEKSYLKIGDFNFEAVKYALSEHTHRLSSSEQKKYKHSYIQSISFDGGVLDGETINLSSELNTLIGIRGSGKSSILETIRYALNIPFGKKILDVEYKKNLANHVLGSGGKITLHAIDQRGLQYEIRRINKEDPDVYVDGILQPGISILETVLHKPIYFGQKDLSSTGAGFEKDLVEKLVGEKLQGIRSEIAEQRQKITEIIRRLKKSSNTGERKKEFNAKKQDAEFKLEFFKKHGVEEKLQKQVDFDSDARKCTQVITFVQNYLSELDSFINQHEDDLQNQKVYTAIRNNDFFTDFFACYDKLLNSFDSVKETFIASKQTLIDLQERNSEFFKIKDGMKEEFAEIERKLAEELKKSGVLAIRPDEFRDLKMTVDKSIQMIKELEKEESSHSNLESELLKELATLNDLWHKEFKIIETELNKVNQNNESLIIQPEFKGDKIAFCKYMKDIFRGSNLRDSTFQNMSTSFVDFGAMFKNEKAGDKSEQTFMQYYHKNLESLLTWQVPNRFIIEYRGKELKHHSLGQRASALILFVLAQQENDIFLIDQPEDDLDNQTIYEDVIKLIRKLKPKTQFIFATHNANFPVLGDAEQIIACSYSEDKIEIEIGSIDCPRIQKKIVDIMEGGKEAFEKRQRRYEIWKPLNF